jgi:hypothetical protein
MANDKAGEKLLDLLDRKAFDPVLKASPSTYSSERDKDRLRDVQDTTRNTQRTSWTTYTRKQPRRFIASCEI